MALPTGAHSDIGINFISNNESFTKSVAKVDGLLNLTQKRLGKVNNFLAVTEKLLLGVGLAALFTGMAIKNAAEGALKSFLKTFTTVTEGTTLYNQSIGKLTAAFEFLKFSIADAFLTSSLGQVLVELILNLLDYFNNLDPSVQAFIAGLLVVIFLFGFALMIIGQVALGFLGITSIIGAILLPLLFIFGSGVLLIGLVVAAILGIFLLLGLAILAARAGNEKLAKILFTIAAIAGVILVILALWFLGPIVAIGILIALIAGFVIAFKLAGKQFKLSFLTAINDIAKAIHEKILGLINKAIEALSAITGMKIGPVGLGFTGLDSQINQLKAEIEEQRAAKAEQEADTKGSESKGTIFNIENITANNAEEFVTSLKETSLFNKGAGIG